MEIEQVPAWYETEGISHVVTSCGDGIHLLCDRWIVCGPVKGSDLATQPGRRICSKCRKRLPQATLRPQTQPAPAANERSPDGEETTDKED